MIYFRPARRSEAKPLIGLYSESGAGKTLGALLLARGFVGPQGTIGMIETESGRGEAYADDPRVPGGYGIRSLRDDFSPEEFGKAIHEAEKDTLDALIIDSASHEWDAIGGVRYMAAMNEDEGKKGMLVWQAPKIAHQRHFMLPLLGTPIPLVILCMRARYPMEEHKAKPEKERWARSESLVPYQSETILFEMFIHGWIDHAHRFHGTKYTRDDLRAVLRDNEPITLDTGRRLAAWAKGGTTAAIARETPTRAGDGVIPEATSGGGTGGMISSSATPDVSHAPGAPEPGARSGSTQAEIICNDFRERFDEVQSIPEGKGWSERWEDAKVKYGLPATLTVPVEAARNRARVRLKGTR